MLYNTAVRCGAKIYPHSKVINVNPRRHSVTLVSGQVIRGDAIIGADGPLGTSSRKFLDAEGKTHVNAKSSGLMMYK
jgi:flavin-dependent dehydrogenase